MFGTGLLQQNPGLALHVLQDLQGTKAQYWRNSEELDHIFPRSELSKRGFDDSELNNFANFWILAKGKNLNKSNKPPAEYFKDVDDTEMKLALIDQNLLDYATFRSFLKKRGKQILELVKDRLGFTDRDFRTPSFAFRPLQQTTLKIPHGSTTAAILTGLYHPQQRRGGGMPFDRVAAAGFRK